MTGYLPEIKKVMMMIERTDSLTREQKNKVLLSLIPEDQRPKEVTSISNIGKPEGGKTTRTVFNLKSDRDFLTSFYQWQKRFKCPVCDKPQLDFVITDKIYSPIICTGCKITFSIEVEGISKWSDQDG